MKFIFWLVILVLLGGAAWRLWRVNQRVYPVEFGMSFSRSHATWLGLDWQRTYKAMLDDLRPPTIRIAARWDEVEPEPSIFDFKALDWQMNEARRTGTKVTLVVGQKTPRWPECHVPPWTRGRGTDVMKEQLLRYVRTVVERYRDHPALEWWQVENEPFILFEFGECEEFHEAWVGDEIELVRSLDPKHPIMVTDSGELGTWRRASRAGDILGTTLYRVVRRPSGRIWRYDWLPALSYRAKAALANVDAEKWVISELQAEPWLTNGNPLETLIEEQEKVLDPARMKKNIEYARHIGARRAYLWGVEWWYWMKEKKSDARYWEITKELMQSQNKK